jgi:HSP20 family protein
MGLPTRVLRGQMIDPFEQAHREFDSLMSRMFAGQGGDGGAGQLAQYAVDVREDADHIYVEAELPGFRKEDVDITLENQTLTITAERSSDKKQSAADNDERKGDWLLRERRYNRFVRSFTLPPTVDEQHCEAKLNEGVLTITLNKREETKPRKVQVN